MESCDPKLLSLIEEACQWKIGSMVLPLYTSLSDAEPIAVDIVKWMSGEKAKCFNRFKIVSFVVRTFVLSFSEMCVVMVL